MRLLSLLLLMLPLCVIANPEKALIAQKVSAVSALYSDGYAKLVETSIQYRTLHNENNKACVNVASFFMEGFSSGNNSAQFLLFLSCAKNKNGEPSILGVHPFYHHKNSYSLATATYKGKLITIQSPQGSVSFTNKNSIWWSANE